MSDSKRIVLYGSSVNDNPMETLPEGNVCIPGIFHNDAGLLTLDDDLLSRHLMLIGGTGCGKSNVFYHIVSQIKNRMEPDDVMIIFDTKGDYYNLFFDMNNDYVMGNSSKYIGSSVAWNIFREILIDGWEKNSIEQNIQELSWSIFREAIDKSKDSFFPSAARDLFATVLLCILKKGESDELYKRESFYNNELKRAFDESDIFDIKSLIESFPEFSSVLSYIGDGSSGQALGVYAELQNSIRRVLIGSFAKKGSFSIRNFVREKSARALFIEYDMSVGNTLAPLYSMIIDLALKEALGRSSKKGNVYLICDEFKLLPSLMHIEDAVNFGRSMGVKVFAGIQSINQLTEAYGEYRGKNIVAGFSSVFGFRANDSETREFIKNLHGKNYVQEQFLSIANTIKESSREANVVEDWDLNQLELGEAVIGIPFQKPFKFKFDLFKE